MKKEIQAFANGLAEALFGFNPNLFGEQLNQTDTLFRNNRNYLVSNMRQLISETYVEHGLVQTIVNVPVDDGMRGGVTIKSKQLSADQIDALQKYLDREDILSSVIGQAHKWNRLFGGAGIIIMTDQDPMTPFDINAIDATTPIEFRAVDMWELDAAASLYSSAPETYTFYGKKIHRSRIMIMKGMIAPSFVRPRLRGWGVSVVEALVNSINQYLKANNIIFEVLDEFKLDIFRFKGLNSTLLQAGGEEKIRRRVSLTNKQKSYKDGIVMDFDDEYDQKQVSFSGVADIQKEVRMQVASDMRMPLTKIFGISAAGMNSGEDDIENYNSMVESTIRSKAKYEILRVLEIVSQQKFGMVPDDLEVEFKPLRVLSAEQEENVKNAKFARDLQAMQAGYMALKEFKEGCNKDGLLSVQIDVDLEKLETAPLEGDPNASEADADDDTGEDDSAGSNSDNVPGKPSVSGKDE